MDLVIQMDDQVLEIDPESMKKIDENILKKYNLKYLKRMEKRIKDTFENQINELKTALNQLQEQGNNRRNDVSQIF
jgi:hypothetical protein